MQRSLSPKALCPDSLHHSRNFSIRRSVNICAKHRLSFVPIRAQQPETKVDSDVAPNLNEVLKVKEWEVAVLQNKLAASQGIRIRRRPPAAPPSHYAGPLEVCVQSEGDTPRNILEEIIWHKDVEVSQLKERIPLSVLKSSVENAPPTRDFIGALKEAYVRTGIPGLIAEVKKASPNRGILREHFDPVATAQSYETVGAACLSVLTDEKFFKGSFENLEAIKKAGVKIYYARAKGADAILLIAAVLPDLDIKYMVKICKNLGMAVLVEVHDEREMDRVLGIEGIELIGIINRSLETFEVDISNTKKFLEGYHGELIRQKDIIVVGESRLFTRDDAYVQDVGVKAVLVEDLVVAVGKESVDLLVRFFRLKFKARKHTQLPF